MEFQEMNCDFSKLSSAELSIVRRELEERYAEFQSRKLKLNMARGKPAKMQLDAVSDILDVIVKAEDCIDEGIDTRNYGELAGIPCKVCKGAEEAIDFIKSFMV